MASLIVCKLHLQKRLVTPDQKGEGVHVKHQEGKEENRGGEGQGKRRRTGEEGRERERGEGKEEEGRKRGGGGVCVMR